MPYCCRFYPEDNNIFLAGCSDNRIVQYDATSGEIVQDYNHHLGPVNTVTFCDSNNRFVSTADDKKVRRLSTLLTYFTLRSAFWCYHITW